MTINEFITVITQRVRTSSSADWIVADEGIGISPVRH